MALELTGREYTNPYRAETTDYFKGNTGDWLGVKLSVTYAVENKYTVANQLYFDIGSKAIENLNGDNWKEQGFDVGDTINIFFAYDVLVPLDPVPTLQSRVITSITGNRLVYTGTEIVPLYMNILPGSTSVDDGTGTYISTTSQNVYAYADKRPEGISFEYGLLANSDYANKNLASFIDGTKRKYDASGLDGLALNATTSLIPQGLKSGLGIEDELIKYKGTGTNPHEYKFELTFNVFINSFFDSDLNGVEDSVFPDVLLNTDALTDNFHIEFQPEYGNPNVWIKNDYTVTKQTGNTGWLDESFNGGGNVFTVSSMTYEDLSSNPLTELDYANATVVKATIQGVGNMVVGTSDFALGFIQLPKNEDEFKLLGTEFHENLYLNTCGVGKVWQLVANGGAFDTTTYNGYSKGTEYVTIKDIRFQVGSVATDVEVQFTVTPNASWNTKFDALPESQRDYALWVSCADSTLTTSLSDRVSILLDSNTMTLQPVQLGAYAGLTNLYLANYQSKSDTGDAVANVFPQDNFTSHLSFTNDFATDNVIINNIDFRIELVHASDGRKFLLDNFLTDLTGEPIDSNDVQQFNYSGSRGFLIDDSTNDHNEVLVQRDATLDSGTDYGYVAYCGLRSRYEDWIENKDLPSEVYDILEANDGYNNFWFYLDSLTNWDVKYVVQIGANADGTVGVYRNEFDIAHQDYDSNANISIDKRFYRELDGSLISDAILKRGEIVRLEVDFISASGSFSSSASDLYVEFQIEENDGGGWKTVYQFSNVHKTQADSPFIPQATYTYLNTSGGGTSTITAICLIDGDKLPVVRYRISAEVKTPITPAYSTKSVLYDGVNELINIGADTSLDFQYNDPFSISAWIYLNGNAKDQAIYSRLSSFVALRGQRLLVNATDKLQLSNKKKTSEGVDLESTNSLSTGQWYHVVGCYGALHTVADCELYINGVAETKVTILDNSVTTTTIATDDASLGGDLTNGMDYLDGYEDEITLYSAKLSSGEVTTLYNGGCPASPSTTNLISYWKMGEGDTYPTIQDNQGSNDGTMVNMESGDITTTTKC